MSSMSVKTSMTGPPSPAGSVRARHRPRAPPPRAGARTRAEPVGQRLAGDDGGATPRWPRRRASSSARSAGSRARPRRRTPRRGRRVGSGPASSDHIRNTAVPRATVLLPHVHRNSRRPHLGAPAGRRAAVLLLGGLGDPTEAWQAQLDAFAGAHRVIAPDNRGAGRSPLPADGVSITAMAEDAAAVVRSLGIASAHVAGFSMGGAIAQELAIRHPELVRSLVLNGTWCRPDAYFRRMVGWWIATARDAELGARPAGGVLPVDLHAARARRRQRRSLHRRDAREPARPGGRGVLRERAGLHRLGGLADRLGMVDVPGAGDRRRRGHRVPAAPTRASSPAALPRGRPRAYCRARRISRSRSRPSVERDRGGVLGPRGARLVAARRLVAAALRAAAAATASGASHIGTWPAPGSATLRTVGGRCAGRATSRSCSGQPSVTGTRMCSRRVKRPARIAWLTASKPGASA